MLLKWEKEGEISVFKERCDGLGGVTGVDGDGHTLRYSKQKFSFAQFLARVCDDAHSGFVMKKVMEPRLRVQWRATSQTREVAHPQLFLSRQSVSSKVIVAA